MRVIIIGGTRFIGPEVVRQLMRQGHDVTVFHRGQTNDERTASARHILGDRSRLTSFRRQFKELKPDIVLDMVPLNGPDARITADTFKGIVPRIVAISSMDVYRGYGVLWNTEKGPVQPIPFTEDSGLRTGTEPHGEEHDKIAVEKIIMDHADFAGTILRLPMVYGRNDRQHRLYEYLKRMMDDRPAILMEETRAGWRWTRGYVENVAAAVCLAIIDDRATGRIYNVGESFSLTEAEWVDKIGRCVRWTGKIVTMPRESLPEHLQSDYNFNQHMVGDTQKIRSELGYTEPVQFEEGLIRAVSWEQENPPDEIDPDDYDYEKEDDALDTYEGAGASNA